jgi:hypothetical protein
MGKNAVVVLLASFLLGISCFGQPFLSVPGDSYDFGPVEQATKVKHVFVLKNTGTATLVIHDLKGT